jgi:hypothetical protein
MDNRSIICPRHRKHCRKLQESLPAYQKLHTLQEPLPACQKLHTLQESLPAYRNLHTLFRKRNP